MKEGLRTENRQDMIMDPWSNNDGNILTNCSSAQEFEDNFTPLTNRLPDSEQYLQILEAKLKKIKNDPNTLKQLQEKREACIQNLLNSETYFEEDDELEIPVENSELYRRILPQKQALNRGEIVELVQYDQLENEEQQQE